MLLPIEEKFNSAKDEFEISAEVIQLLISKGIINKESHSRVLSEIEKKKSDLPTRDTIIDCELSDEEAQEQKYQDVKRRKESAESIVSGIPVGKERIEQFIKEQYYRYMRSINELRNSEQSLIQEYEKMLNRGLSDSNDIISKLLSMFMDPKDSDKETSVMSNSAEADEVIRLLKSMFGENFVIKNKLKERSDAEKIAEKENIRVVALPSKLYKAVAGLKGRDGQEIAPVESLIEKVAKEFVPVDISKLTNSERMLIEELHETLHNIGEEPVDLHLYEFPRGYEGVKVAGYVDSEKDGVIHMSRNSLYIPATRINTFITLAAEANMKRVDNRRKLHKSGIITIQQVGRALGVNGYIRTDKGVEPTNPLEKNSSVLEEKDE